MLVDIPLRPATAEREMHRDENLDCVESFPASSSSSRPTSSTPPTSSSPPPSPHRKGAPSKSKRHERTTLFPHGLAPVSTTVDNHWLYLYFRFCAERHRMYDKRQAGIARDELTEDETLRKTFVGNIFRELDGGSYRMRDKIIALGDQSHEEICFRIFLFCGFYLDSTWDALVDGLGHVPSWKTFDLGTYERILHRLSFEEQKKIFYGGFQIVPPVVYFGRTLPHYAATLRFVVSLMEMSMPEQLAQCRYAVDASNTLQTAPTLGGFLSLNLLCYLNDSPHLSFSYRSFATCGPGSRSYLQRIFGKAVINSRAMEDAGLRWLFHHQWRYWARIGETPPHAHVLDLTPGMRVIDLENALCWCHRYVHDFERRGYRSLADMPPPTFDSRWTEEVSTPAWCEREHLSKRGEASRAAWTTEEDKLKLASVDDNETYEVEKVVGRVGSRDAKNGLFRVRWKGYPPEDDTWEKGSTLRDGASEALDDWLQWEARVRSAVRRVNEKYPYASEELKQELKGKRKRPSSDNGPPDTAGNDSK